ncbi:sensor histidine kinase [Acidiferrobacter sp.]|uniref:sensor histidine kinase n=1 Tax=Acidiferrobacter sp. TaxID=1872107 RepID=UPI0026122AFD|nr:histidine kinase [Acidiferrobacter sp.]
MKDSTSYFLPDFGSLAIAAKVLFMAEVIAVIFTIASSDSLGPAALRRFVFLSAYTLIVALVSLGLLRVVHRGLRQLSAIVGSLVVIALILVAVVMVIEGLISGLYGFGVIATRTPVWQLTLVIHSVLISIVVMPLVLRYLFVSHKAQIDAKLEQEARMQALQSRIRPHFLFNSMNSIASLTRSDPPRAEAALQDLADLFRVLLADARKLVPISAEQEISRQYLEIEKLRLGDRLSVHWTVSNVPRNALIPALTLQPLLENAIYHGIEPRFGGGTVKVELWADQSDTLNVLISNPIPEVRKHAHGRGNKIAMDNIRQRLVTHFLDAASLQAFEEGDQYHVRIKMPIIRNQGERSLAESGR